MSAAPKESRPSSAQQQQQQQSNRQNSFASNKQQQQNAKGAAAVKKAEIPSAAPAKPAYAKILLIVVYSHLQI